MRSRANNTLFLPPEFFQRPPVDCARDLIGCALHWDGCSGIVVETEAYAAKGDEACHTFRRPGARAFVRNHPAGTAYVYLCYGFHWLFNVLTKSSNGTDGFVLVRALEPNGDTREMLKRYGRTVDPHELCRGPGRLTRALGITGAFHGTSLCGQPSRGFTARQSPARVLQDVRIGISLAKEFPWRFLLEGSPHASRSPGNRNAEPPR